MHPVKPYYVRFHWSDGFAPFLVTHEAGPDEEDSELRSGWVVAADADNDAGLDAGGWNRRDRIGHGGPGIPGSWSEYEED